MDNVDDEAHHNVEYDHEAFLGKDEEKTFDQLTPEESKERLGYIMCLHCIVFIKLDCSLLCVKLHCSLNKINYHCKYYSASYIIT